MIYSCKDCGGKISFSSAKYGNGRCRRCAAKIKSQDLNFIEKWNYFFTKKMEKHHV